MRLRMTLVRNPLLWEKITRMSIAITLWEIFVDARQFFNTPFGINGEFPQTMLAIV